MFWVSMHMNGTLANFNCWRSVSILLIKVSWDRTLHKIGPKVVNLKKEGISDHVEELHNSRTTQSILLDKVKRRRTESKSSKFDMGDVSQLLKFTPPK